MLYEFSQFRLDADNRRLMSADGQPIDAPANVLDALIYLLEHAEQTVDERALQQVLQADTEMDECTPERAVDLLRSALGDDATAQRFIATQPGGYRFVGEVQTHVSPVTPQPTSPNDAPLTVGWLIFAVAAFATLAFIALWALQRSPYG